MSGHPFAIQCDAAIAHLRDLLDKVSEVKETADAPEEWQWWDWIDSLGRKRRTTKIFGRRDLGALASQNQRVDISDGGGLASDEERAKPPKKKPKNVDSLTWAYMLAVWDCQTKRARANSSYFRCLSQRDATKESCKPFYVSVSCPDVERLRDLIAKRDADKKAAQSSSGSGFNGQGGQFGGGGASGGF